MQVIVNLLMRFILYSSLVSKTVQWTTACNNQGKCHITYSSNRKVYIKPGYYHKSTEKGAVISKEWNKTYERIHISKQIDGISPYGLIKGSKEGYECSGGLSECLNSCCLNGFCVEILYYCSEQREFIEQIYIITCTSFLFFVSIYWVTFFVLGCSYNRMVGDQNEIKNASHHYKARSIPKDFAYNQSLSQIERESSRLETVRNENTERRLNTSNNDNHQDLLHFNENKLPKSNCKSLIHQFNNHNQTENTNENYKDNNAHHQGNINYLRNTSSYKDKRKQVIQIKLKKNY